MTPTDAIPADNPVAAVANHQGVMILDGGLATALEARGWSLDDDLWSARLLLDHPDAVAEVHTAFLAAGADCIASVGYQATIPGFVRRGHSEQSAVRLLHRAVEVAVDARDRFWSQDTHPNRLRPLVAASVGPYGAFLADGSEYTGAYDLDEHGLYAFHRERWRILAQSQADLIVAETVPSQSEARALIRLVRETDRWAWISFSCRDGTHLHDGNRVSDVVRDLTDAPHLAAIGINCTPPRHVASLITELREATDIPILAYPNSGERFDPGDKTWHADEPAVDLAAAAAEWVDLGAVGVGGCCRVPPSVIARMRAVLLGR